MEETFLRAKGFPVLIAETERFRIREIQKEDIQALYEISRQDGMEYAYADPEQAKCFERERMESYISTVYRFYGYGLWTAETLSGEIIGCCGFSDFCMTEHIADKTEELLVLYKDIKHDTEHDTEYDTENPETESGLELQYFTANRFQNQGYGTEMCRAAIKYAQERLTLCRLYVRVHVKNTASVRVAEKLGFRYLETEWS